MAILKQVVDLQETVKRMMEQNDKLRRELNATRCELYKHGDLCQICKHWQQGHEPCEILDMEDCTSCGNEECACYLCVNSSGSKGYKWVEAR